MTKEKLRHYQTIKREREQLRHQLEEIETALYYPKIPQLHSQPGGGSHEGNPVEDLALHHIELQQRYREKLEELAAEQLAIETAIESLDPRARMLMRYRYIEGLKWEAICVKMNYSWVSVHDIHGKALLKLRGDE